MDFAAVYLAPDTTKVDRPLVLGELGATRSPEEVQGAFDVGFMDSRALEAKRGECVPEVYCNVALEVVITVEGGPCPCVEVSCQIQGVDGVVYEGVSGLKDALIFSL